MIGNDFSPIHICIILGFNNSQQKSQWSLAAGMNAYNKVLTLIFDVVPNSFRTCFAYRTHKISISPKGIFFPKMLFQKRSILLSKMISCDRFEPIDYRKDRHSWDILYHQMNMVFICFNFYDIKIRFFSMSKMIVLRKVSSSPYSSFFLYLHTNMR